MRQFKRVSIVSGVLFAAFILITFRHGYLPLVLLYSLFAGAIFGAALGFLARYIDPRARTRVAHLVVFALFSYPIMFFVGNFIIVCVFILPREGWHTIERVPVKPVRFAGTSSYTFWGGALYVEAEDGSIWSYPCYMEGPCRWEQEPSLPPPPEPNFWTCGSGFDGIGIAAPTLSRVVDERPVRICGVDYTIYVKYILLDSGEIRVWSQMRSALEVPFILVPSNLAIPIITAVGIFSLLKLQKEAAQQ